MSDIINYVDQYCTTCGSEVPTNMELIELDEYGEVIKCTSCIEKITININTSNSAFYDGNVGCESARILREFADKLEDGYKPTRLRDMNGNIVGFVTYNGGDE